MREIYEDTDTYVLSIERDRIRNEREKMNKMEKQIEKLLETQRTVLSMIDLEIDKNAVLTDDFYYAVLEEFEKANKAVALKQFSPS